MQAQLEEVLSRILLPDNAVRAQAEAQFEQMRTQPDQVAQGLLTVSVNAHAQPDLRRLAVVLLRSSIFTTRNSLWAGISAQTRAGVKQGLLQAVLAETVADIRHKLCDTLAELAVIIFTEVEGVSGPQDWPELLTFIFNCCSSQQSAHRESGLSILTRLAIYLSPVLTPHLPALQQIFVSGLKDNDFAVRIAALHATVSFVEFVFDQQTKVQFQSLLPDMMQSVSIALNNGKEQDAQACLSLFVELAEGEPLFFRPLIGPICELVAQICTTQQLEDTTRQTAMELLVTFCENKPGMMRKIPGFIQALVQICVSFMLEVVDDDEWLKSGDAVEVENPDVGSESLDRLCIALRGTTMVPLFHRMLPELLGSPDWKHRFSGVQTMCIMGEGCREDLYDDISSVAALLLPHFKDPHARVRYQACNTLGQMCSDFVPKLQHENAALLLPPLLDLLRQETVPKVQAHACSALINWSDGIEPDSLIAYVEPLLASLAHVMQNSPVIAQEQAVLAVAALSDTLEHRFTPYYDRFIPLLKNILVQAQGPAYRELRANALVTITMIAASVGPEKFRPDAAHILPIMVQIQNSKLEEDDPMVGYLMQSWARVCSCLKEEFVPYLSLVMPELLEQADRKPEVRIATKDNYDELSSENIYDFLAIGDKNLAIKTTDMVSKAAACNTIFCYANDLKHHFMPYVQQCTTIMAPLLEFYFDASVRAAAATAMPSLLQCVIAYCQVTNGNHAMVKQLWDTILPHVLNGLASEIEVHVWCDKVGRAKDCLELVGPGFMSDEQTTDVLTVYMEVLQRCLIRKQHLVQKSQEIDFDEVEAMMMDDETGLNEDLLSQLADFHAQIVRVSTNAYLALLPKLSSQNETLVQLMFRMINQPTTPADTQIGVCMLDDIIEFGGDAARSLYGNIVPVIIGHIQSPHSEVVQAAVYGAGVYAEVAPTNDPRQTALLKQVLAKLRALIEDPESRTLRNANATDNAISAVAKIIKFKPQICDNLQATMSFFVASLPVTADQIEAKVIYRMLIEFLEGNHQCIWGSNNSNLPHLLDVLVRILGTKFVKKKDNPRIVALIAKIFNNFGAAAQQASQQMHPDMQQKLHSLSQ